MKLVHALDAGKVRKEYYPASLHFLKTAAVAQHHLPVAAAALAVEPLTAVPVITK